jgi:hypothetical protein
MSRGAPDVPAWSFGTNRSTQQWHNKMQKRGWTPNQITEAIQGSQAYPATNQINPAHTASRYVHPTTGRSVVVDDVTMEVIHVGGDGFLY